jgi:uncharacterized protein DUF1707
VLAGDRDRERGAAALREHYARGRLTLDELSARTGEVLAARSIEDVRRAVSGGPVFPDLRELAAHGRSLARVAMLVAASGAYFIFCMTLLLVMAVTVLANGASTPELVAFLVVWLVPTYLYARLWRRRPAQTRRRF